MVSKIVAFGDGLNQLIKGSLILFRRWIKQRKPMRIGEMVEILDEEGDAIACGLWDKIGVRVLGFDECPGSVEDLIRMRFEDSKRVRERLGYIHVYRLIHGDGDLFPGLVVDVYGPLAVVQSSSMAIDTIMPIIVRTLREVTGVDTVAEKSVQRVRSRSNLPFVEKIHVGNRKEVVVEVDGEGVKYLVSLKSRKTGLYLDQRENRIFTKRFSKDVRFLDLFSYTGGFGLNALHGGAKKVVFVDKDKDALSILKINLRLNGFDESKSEIFHEDAFRFLKRALKRRIEFDVTSVDPPAFMDDYKEGLKMYKEAYTSSSLITQSISILSSCSRKMNQRVFLSTIFESVREPYRLLETRGSAPDHPIRRGLEDYLKTAFVFLEG